LPFRLIGVVRQGTVALHWSVRVLGKSHGRVIPQPVPPVYR
jgi:hypothetical protein